MSDTYKWIKRGREESYYLDSNLFRADLNKIDGRWHAITDIIMMKDLISVSGDDAWFTNTYDAIEWCEKQFEKYRSIIISYVSDEFKNAVSGLYNG